MVRVAVRVLAFIGRSVCGTGQALVKSPLNLRHPNMQRTVPGLVAARAHRIDFSLKAIFVLARIRTR
jgi:hypothetical protein